MPILFLVMMAMSAAMAVKAGQDQKKAYQSAADQAQANALYNSQLAQQQADDERTTRAAKEAEEMRANRRRRAVIEGLYAKSGVLLEGTPGAMLTEQATVDAENVQNNTLQSLRKRQYLIRQGQFSLLEGDMQATAYREQGKAAAMQGFAGGASSLAGGFMSYKKV